jgi:acyl-CoA reductase-like NAD-dependent aldehyde dehydrogenase
MQIGNYIGGRTLYPKSGILDKDYAPATGELLAEVGVSDAEDVQAAYEAARAAQPGWASMGIDERGKRLRAWADAVRKEVDALSLLDARDSGSPRRTMRVGVQKGTAYVDYFCGIAHEIKGETLPITPDNLHYTRREPYGVVGVIIPFNHPALFALSKTSPALVAGNTVILKPSELTPLVASRIAEISKDYLPPGVFNVVHGKAEVGRAIVGHPDIWRIQFTGGVETGLAVLKGAAESGRVKQVTLELGGKNPLIVFPDVDIETTAKAAILGMNFTRNQGQSCGSTSRLFVHKQIAKELTEAIIEGARKIQVGLPEDEQTEMGSLASHEHQRRVLDYIASGVNGGARLCLGGGAPDGEFAKGAYVEPTVFDQVHPDMKIAMEEIFGPVLSIIAWDDEDAMMQAVNQVQYGLAAAIYTNDLSTAIRCANRVQAGYVWVNGIETRWIGAPFGGYKNSGLGSEHSLEELLSYTRIKMVNILV